MKPDCIPDFETLSCSDFHGLHWKPVGLTGLNQSNFSVKPEEQRSMAWVNEQQNTCKEFRLMP